MKCCARLAPHAGYAERFISDPLQTWLYSWHAFPSVHLLSSFSHSSLRWSNLKTNSHSLFRENDLVLLSLCFSNWKWGWWAVLNTVIQHRERCETDSTELKQICSVSSHTTCMWWKKKWEMCKAHCLIQKQSISWQLTMLILSSFLPQWTLNITAEY